MSFASLEYDKTDDYVIHDHYVTISSGGRDTSKYPLHFDYKVDFQIPFRNIRSVEIVSCVIPDESVTTEPVVIFNIDELNFMSFISSSGYKNIFAAFPISEPNAQNHSFINLKAQGPTIKYRTPLASLSSATVKLYNVDYQPLTFGVPAGSISKALQHTFVLKVSVEESSTKPIEFRKLRRDN